MGKVNNKKSEFSDFPLALSRMPHATLKVNYLAERVFFLRSKHKFYLKFRRGFIDTWLSDEEPARISTSPLNTFAT